ncbi:phage protein [Streptococcus pneumoniae]|nr:phage protein [Streptococcus pneumoniae]VMH56321.1 phage protein [Streptococcus pneumoniae]VMU84549.1 phage protein [Streptococcus pneumoniae]VMZ40336.1 phage protein [Streptococcus pneumoniae]VNS88010.1 phage protein [Streptococcus pneumoniae]
MKLNELIKKYKKLEGVWNAEGAELARQIFLQDLEQLDESEIGYADEAPRYVKNILARLRELPLHDREVWLKAIMSEFEQDFSRAKWREGYEQGKIEGMVEREKVKVPRFVAEWIEEARKACKDVVELFEFDFTNDEVRKWFMQERPFDLVARAWLDGYEVEEEKRYFVKIKGNIKENMLVYGELLKRYFFTKSFSLDDVIYSHTRKELEDANFGWVFDCEGIDIEEVENE